MASSRLISIVVPAMNEQDNVRPFYKPAVKRVEGVKTALAGTHHDSDSIRINGPGIKAGHLTRFVRRHEGILNKRVKEVRSMKGGEIFYFESLLRPKPSRFKTCNGSQARRAIMKRFAKRLNPQSNRRHHAHSCNHYSSFH